jgi:hypothetical protein
LKLLATSYGRVSQLVLILASVSQLVLILASSKYIHSVNCCMLAVQLLYEATYSAVATSSSEYY